MKTSAIDLTYSEAAASRIQELEAENTRLKQALELYPVAVPGCNCSVCNTGREVKKLLEKTN